MYLKKLLTFLLFLTSAISHAQIENVIVETYYISDSNDATDTTLGRSVPVGSKTYRIYIDLVQGSKIRKIYGDQNHTLRIASTDNFYNNIDRPEKFFGYLLNKSWLDDNPTLALDSWLTIGMAVTDHMGILKSDDHDGCFSYIANNTGGTAGISGGLLQNNDPLAGIPVTTSDGYVPSTNSFGTWIDVGFIDGVQNVDTTVFGSVNTGNVFISNSAYLQQSSGVSGPDSVSNIVLVAQLTTLGDLSFEINLEVEQFDGVTSSVINYVAKNDTLLPGEVLNPLLNYPPACGCTDPDFLEYSEIYACSDNSTCITPVVLGCMDPLACNFDPDANFPVPTLCCYPGHCNDRDLGVVCPDISSDRLAILNTYPNPAENELMLQLAIGKHESALIRIYNTYGQIVHEERISDQSAVTDVNLDLNKYAHGIYTVHLVAGNELQTKSFIKK